MSITDKTRKRLWGRSGNRCAICKLELVEEKDENDVSLNLGEECHIISEKINGPRYNSNIPDYDVYDNLILLCRNHHITIDTRKETYTLDLIKWIKSSHEAWVKDVIDNAVGSSEKFIVRFYTRIKTGKELVDIISSSNASHLTNDELTSQAEVGEVADLFQSLKDWIDIGFDNIGHKVELSFDLNSSVKRLEEMGLFIFGDCLELNLVGFNKRSIGKFPTAVIFVLRKDNQIIQSSEVVLAQVPCNSYIDW